MSGRKADRGAIVRDILIVVFVISGAIYLSWRPSAFNARAPVFSTVFYIAEIASYLAALLRLYVTRGSRPQVFNPPPPPDLWPSIDVFVTTYREPLHVVRRTLFAAKTMSGRHETFLLDDGNRPEMAALAEELGCRYLARWKNTGAKAGNLNHALANSSGDFIAIFDADHVAEERFLKRLIGYFAEPRVGLVQTPQDYFNTDSFQHGRGKRRRSLWHEQSVFHWVEQPGRDVLDATTCCGCSMVLRRAALDDIGGFPSGTVTEDMHASVKLHKRGWHARYHAEPLAYGIAAADAFEFLRQRLRWGEGNMQVCRIERIPFTRELTFSQNMSYLMLGTTYLESWVKLMTYVAPIVFLFTLVPPIYTDSRTFLAYFLPYLAAGLISFTEFGRGYAPLLLMERFAMARLSAGIVSTTGFVRRNIRFRVTSKEVGGHYTLFEVLPQALVFGLSVVGLVFFFRAEMMRYMPVPAGIGFVIALLALYNAILAAWVIAGSVRTWGLREESWSCPEPFPFRVNGGTLQNAFLLSADQLVCKRNRGTAIEAQLEIYFPKEKFTPRAVASQRRSETHWSLSWPDQATRDRFEQRLYAGRWRRPLAGRNERRWTWLERLRILRAPWSWDNRPRVWQWGIWTEQGGSKEGLACLSDSRVAVLFGRTAGAASDVVQVEYADGTATMRITEAAAPEIPDLEAIFAVGGAFYAVTPAP